MYFLQYYGIFFGLTYIFVNIEKRLVKFYVLVKIYVYFVNLIYAGTLIYFMIDFIKDIFYVNEANALMEFAYIMQNIARLFTIIYLVIMRIKEEKAFKKLHTLYVQIQSTNFNKITQTSTDKITEIIQIFNIVLIYCHGVYTIYRVVLHLVAGGWLTVMEESSFLFYTVINNYVLFRHSLILSLIGKWLSNLNNQLNTTEINYNFPSVYHKVCLLMDEVNQVNGNVILSALISQVITVSINIYYVTIIVLTQGIFNMSAFWVSSILLIIFVYILLYFLICDRFNSITQETVDILKEYNEKQQNQEVYY